MRSSGLRFVPIVTAAATFALAVFVFFLLPALAINAQDASPFEVVADELDNPRGLTFGPRGDLYIAEAGRGGDGPCFVGPEGGAVCFGLTGAVTAVWEGEQQRIVEGLPSIAAQGNETMPAGSSAVGPQDIALLGRGNAYVMVGLGADPTVRQSLGERAGNLGELLRLTPDGGWITFVDVAGHESSENPDGGHIDSNPNSVIALPGERIVVDAGGNSLLYVGANRQVRTLAVFPDRQAAAPEMFGGPPGATIPMQSVPTSVVLGPDGALYIGELTGFPYPVGGARVYRMLPGEQPEVYADGFTNIIDLAFDEDGELLVLEIATNGLLSGDMTGALKRANGSIIVSEGLVMPAGLAVGPDGAYYVSNCGVCAGTGQVVRIEPE